MAANPEESTEPRPRRARRVSAVPRAVVMGIDTIERRVSFVAAGVGLLLAADLSPHLLKNSWITVTAKAIKGHTCAAAFHWNTALKTCSHLKLVHPTYYLPQFIFILFMTGGIVVFAQMRKRVGVAFAGFLLGLALGPAGLPFLLLGGWLLLRALRLQRYGEASFFGSSRIAREQAQAKREGRPVVRRTRAKKEPEATLIRPVAPAPSKRYTPKKPTRKR